MNNIREALEEIKRKTTDTKILIHNNRYELAQLIFDYAIEALESADTWSECEKEEPFLSDRSILMHFANGSIETVHVEDYFKPITAGVVDGIQQYTKWWKREDPACTHWMEIPPPPDDWKP